MLCSQACIMCVPKYYPVVEGEDDADYLTRMGYKEKAPEGAEDPSAPQVLHWESTEDYLNRMKGYLLFYAALLQSDAHPKGPGKAWTYLARYELVTFRITFLVWCLPLFWTTFSVSFCFSLALLSGRYCRDNHYSSSSVMITTNSQTTSSCTLLCSRAMPIPRARTRPGRTLHGMNPQSSIR